MKSSKLKITTIIMSIVIMGSSVTANAHSGRTDSNGGHRDNKNVSGLGPYHYHHGFGPHLHDNGCPYNNVNATGSNSSSSKSKNNSSASQSKNNNSVSQSQKDGKAKKAKEARKAEEDRIKKEAKEREEKANAKESGYKDGYNAGYSKEEDRSDEYNKNYREEYIIAYKEGYNTGYDTIETEIRNAKNYGYNTGYNGEKDNENYANELIAEAYKEGYEEGYNKYKTQKIEEYKLKGENDALEANDAMDFEEEMAEFKEVYMSAYNSKKEELEAEKGDSNISLAGGIVALGAIGSGAMYYKKKKKK